MAPADGADPGTAIVAVHAEPGHRDEVEVRADATTFSTRVWPKGAWMPVVRDRTSERIVSGDPEWGAPPSRCAQLALHGYGRSRPAAVLRAEFRPSVVERRATNARMAVGSDKSTRPA